MEETKKSSGFFVQGWIMVAITFVTAIVTQGFGLYSFSMFKLPMTEMLGAEATQVALGFSIYALVAGFTSLVVGDIINKIKVRGCLILGGILFGGGFIILGTLDSLYMVYVAYVIMGMGTALSGMIIVSGIPNNWFVKKRGIAIGVTWCATLPGSLITTRLVSAAAADGDWQKAAIILGVISIVVLVVAAFLLKWRPQDIGLLPDGMTPEEAAEIAERAGAAKLVGLDRKKALKAPAFWLLFLGFALVGVGEQGPFQNMPTFLVTAHGYDLAAAGSFMTFLSFAGCCGKLAAGVIVDKSGPKLAYCILNVCAACGLIAILFLGDNPVVLYICGFFFGAALSSSAVCFSAGTSKFLGPKHFAQLYGMVFLGKPIMDAIGVPLVAGMGASAIGWNGAFFMAAAFILLSATCMALNKKDKELEAMEAEAAKELSSEK